MERSEIIGWLVEDDPKRLRGLWALADRARREHVGNAVHLRGLIEVSNHCVRQCAYCGIRAGNRHLERYRMSEVEIIACVQEAVERGYGTVVMQAGEDPQITGPWMADVVGRIKRETPLAVTLSLGERSVEELRAWREAGADRYLLRFETSNRALYERLHPPLPGRRSDRVAQLAEMRALGYEVGSGVMVGLPGQTYEDLAQDLELFRDLPLDMIGIGPYIPHPHTPLGAAGVDPRTPNADSGQQVPNTELMGYKMVALARLVCPRANIPSTTALATVSGDASRQVGLERGANIVMPNLTPARYRVMYDIYPSKGRTQAVADGGDALIREGILALGREIGTGRGDSPRRLQAAGRTPGL
ncbi:MAG: [FeFe] hydrogenase H-cluster radical SAM maturase HydE [Armatimonadetes bacterium]|nr:[FeFe] hydrogenase H-cluster radical SAM maturase HydE [Armatimonadota bacterium]